MGRSTDATGKPTYQPTPTETVADLQAAVDYAEKVGGLLQLTSAERTALTPGETKVGWMIVETDTGMVYLRTASAPQGVIIAGAKVPEIDLIPNGSWNVNASGANVNVFAAPGTGLSVASVPGWFEYDLVTGDIKVLKSGAYSIMARLSVQPAAASTVEGVTRDQTLVAQIIRNGGGGPLTQDLVETNPSFQTFAKLDVASVVLNANDRVRVYIQTTSTGSASLTVGGFGRSVGEFNVRFIGPA